MKKLFRMTLAVLVLSLLASAAEPRKKRIAIMDFEYGTVHSNVRALFGSDVDVGRGITDLLVKYLVKDGTYSVIERKALDKILAEQNFSTSDRANPATAAKIGQLLGVDAMIFGSITQFGFEDKSMKIGGVGGGWGGFGLGGVGRKKSKAIVTVDARIVDIDTAEILGVADGRGLSERSSTSLVGGGGSWGGFGAGGVDFSSSNFQETILGEAVKSAVEQMSAGLIQESEKLKARTINIEALLAFVDPSMVVLNVGSKSGLKVGDKLSVERVTREIKDPSSGKVLRRMTDKIGVIEVTNLDDTSAEAKIVSGAGFKVGDVAKTTTE